MRYPHEKKIRRAAAFGMTGCEYHVNVVPVVDVGCNFSYTKVFPLDFLDGDAHLVWFRCREFLLSGEGWESGLDG